MFTPGATVQERYVLRESLNQGPVRQTWLALDQQEQELVVLKVLFFAGSLQWQDVTLFEREAQILESLDHPLIPHFCTP